jgi:hypothetical protein
VIGSPNAETLRLKRHFDRTLASLTRAEPGPHSRPARRRRERALRALVDYRERGRFPKNDWGCARAPVFIDSRETRCAMAHLIEQSGFGHLVERVASHRNHAYVRDLARDEELLEWLRAHGLTVAEAARIQPSYARDWNYLAFCSQAPYGSLLQVSVVDRSSARVLAVFGQAPGVKVGQVLQVEPFHPTAKVPVGHVQLVGWSLRDHVPSEGPPLWRYTGHEVHGDLVMHHQKVPLDTAIRALKSERCGLDLADFFGEPEEPTIRPGFTVPPQTAQTAQTPQPSQTSSETPPDGCSRCSSDASGTTHGDAVGLALLAALVTSRRARSRSNRS